MRRHLARAALVLAATGLALPATADDHPWRPDRPIQIIVPWSAGGATDQVTRILAGELEEALGQSVVVVNQPGASGVVGTSSAWNAESDGHTWAAGAPADLGLYQIREQLDVNLAEWRLYLHIANVTVVGVNPDRPWQTFAELLDHMRANPGTVTVGTSGVASLGHQTMEAISRAAGGIEYRHIPYDGGGPAVIATVAGETDLTTQLLSEQAEMIRAGRLRPLAVVEPVAVEVAGFGAVPPITEWLPEISVATNYFGIWAPNDIPDDVKETMDRIWSEQIANSQRLKDYAADRGALFDPSYGFEAYLNALPKVSEFAWRFFDEGQIQLNPAAYGIPRLD